EVPCWLVGDAWAHVPTPEVLGRMSDGLCARLMPASHSLRSGGGRVDARGAWLVGAKGEYPLHRPYPLPASSILPASSNPKSWISFATTPVHPVWWLAPNPAPFNPVEVLVERDVVVPMGDRSEISRVRYRAGAPQRLWTQPLFRFDHSYW